MPTFAGVETYSVLALYFRSNYGIGVVTSASVNSQVTNNDPALQSVTASGGRVPLIVFGCAQCVFSNDPPFTTASPAFDQEVNLLGSNLDFKVGFKIYNSSPQNHSIDMADIQANGLSSFYLELKA